MLCVNAALPCLTKPVWSRWPLGLWPWTRTQNKPMHDLSASCPPQHPHRHIHTQRNPFWRQAFPLKSVCDMAARLLKTNRGNPPCLALSITSHLNIQRHVPGCKPSLTPRSKNWKIQLTSLHRHTQTCTPSWLQTSSPDAGTHFGRKFKERSVAFYSCQNISGLTPSWPGGFLLLHLSINNHIPTTEGTPARQV